jgi:hypothetical protein
MVVGLREAVEPHGDGGGSQRGFGGGVLRFNARRHLSLALGAWEVVVAGVVYLVVAGRPVQPRRSWR